jgi:hypothetical protein
MTRKYQQLAASTLIVAGVLVANIAFAQIVDPLNGKTFSSLLSAIVTALQGLLIGLGTLSLVIAGILYVLSAGNPDLAKTAKSALFWGCAGILLGLVATAIVTEVQTAAAAGGLTAIIKSITTTIGSILVPLGSVMVIVSGILYVTSAGDPAKMKAAKTALMYAITGIVIGLAISAIVAFIQNIAKGP